MLGNQIFMPDYLQWESDLSLETVFSTGNSFSYPTYFGQHIIYVTTLKKENSRQALMLKSESGVDCITPQPFNLRTKVNEYGGKAFWLFSDRLFFVNQSDQCLYQQHLVESKGKVIASEPVLVTPKPKDDCVFMFTDVILVADAKILAIVEQSNPFDESAENDCFIAQIDFSATNTRITRIEQGASFYSNLVYSEHSQHLAWVQWDHPLMPWDATQAYVATLETVDYSIVEKHAVPLEASASVCQLCFTNNGRLFFSADFSNELDGDASFNSGPGFNFWNVHCYEPSTKKITKVTNEELEFGYPHWQYGDSRIVQLDGSNLLTIGSSPKGDQLFLINQNDLSVTALSFATSTVQSLSSDGQGRALMVELPMNQGPRMLAFEDRATVDVTKQILAQPLLNGPNVSVLDGSVSMAEHVSFTCADGEKAYGFYYPPSNANYELSKGAPPLIVMVHGGPTARAYGHYDIQKQFWTSRGFALFDVNHRGSSGYGRHYRDALYNNWGELDCADIIDGINSLVDAGKVDAKRVCIRGKSAGGYAVLRALTQYPNVFKAGACYYGIGNLSTLAQTTHKFEKHYTDRLIGEPYSHESAKNEVSRFYQRSPIHNIDQLKSAMIVFQGSLDNVVPPTVAHEVVSVLKRLDLDYEYIEYPDEAHGFRQVANNIDAWGRELAFYQRVLRNSIN